MDHHILVGFGVIVFAGLMAQLLAWRLKVPSILFLLLFGFIAGPVTGWLVPDEVFGAVLFPFISVSVGIILFEGGLSLRFKDIKGLRAVIFSLISIGVVVTWALVTVLGIYLLQLPTGIALILGAILTVTGPTVIIPLLNHIKPKAPLSPILMWEGILIDPVGATLSVLVFEAVILGTLGASSVSVVRGIFFTILVGGSLGLAGGFGLAHAIKKYWIPDHLQNPVTLSLVILIYIIADTFQAESGLLAVTVMGVTLANISNLTVRHILEFKENLRVLLIAVLFIVLAARIDLSLISSIDPVRALLFLCALIFIIRPLAVFASSFSSTLNIREKVFLCFVAPRGIVAAAVASLFSIQLAEKFGPDAALLVSYTFIVIVGSVVFYSFFSAILARWLKVSAENTYGLLIIGAGKFSIALAKTLQEQKIKTTLIDTNARNVYLARQQGLTAVHGDFLKHHDDFLVDTAELAQSISLTPNDQANSLAALHFSEDFGRANIYQLYPADYRADEDTNETSVLTGRFCFTDYQTLLEKIRTTEIKVAAVETDQELDEWIKGRNEEKLIPLILILPDQLQSQIFNKQSETKIKAGSKIIYI